MHLETRNAGESIIPSDENALKPYAVRLTRDFRVAGKKIKLIDRLFDSISETAGVGIIIDFISRPKYDIGVACRTGLDKSDFKILRFSFGEKEFRTEGRAKNAAEKIAQKDYGINWKKRKNTKTVWMYDMT